MTWDRRSLGVWRCDTCSVREVGYLEELPVGWVEGEPVATEMNRATKKMMDAVTHLCPKCVTLAQPKLGE